MRRNSPFWHRNLCRLLTLVLLISSLTLTEFPADPAAANAAGVKTRILEITDTGVSDISSLVSGKPIELTTQSMKKFVAMREDLDGRYDAIYIGRGVYNPALPPNSGDYSDEQKIKAHDTRLIQNDITNLKANEIITQFVNKGLPVILYSDSTTKSGLLFQGKYVNTSGATVDGNLKLHFAKYNVQATAKNNVIFVNETHLSTYNNFIAKTDLITRSAGRPRYTLISQPVDYTSNTNQIYKAGDTLTFQFRVDKEAGYLTGRKLSANLYLSVDQVLPLSKNQQVARMDVTSLTNNEISFKLPKGFSGPQYWTLELSDATSNLREVKTGVIRFRDELTKIQVLQILPNDNSNSSLRSGTNMNQSYLTTEDYKISIDTMVMKDFIVSGYQSINGKYDMLLFGFRDMYNSSAAFNQASATAVQAFIQTGQSVMFTHDTMYVEEKDIYWLNTFQEATGQIAPLTNIGLKGRVKSTLVKKVNSGLLSQFPFNLPDTATKMVNQTHNQYFTLNLEDRNVIPWYNIIGGGYPRDDEDSWNNYYTYSKGNVTYSGTGHTNTGFPDWEQKLFVNTMFRAYIGSNHAPVITPISPVAYSSTLNNVTFSENQIQVSYKLDDYDMQDRNQQIMTSISFTVGGVTTQVMPDRAKLSGDTVTESFPNPLPLGGDLMVKIKATDYKGASSEVEIPVKVVKTSSNLTISRNISSPSVEKNTPAVLTYRITPEALIYNPLTMLGKSIAVKNLKWTETFPANLVVEPLSQVVSSAAKSGTLSGGYTLNAVLPDVKYRQSGLLLVADPIEFSVRVTPQGNGTYVMDKSSLAFNDFFAGTPAINDLPRVLPFTSQTLNGVTTITSLSLEGEQLRVGQEEKMLPLIQPADATQTSMRWESSRPDIVSVNDLGVITALKQGEAAITASTLDGSKLSAQATVTVIPPVLSLYGESELYLGQETDLSAELTDTYEAISSYNWTVVSGDSSIRLTNGTQSSIHLEGLRAGEAVVRLKVETDRKNVYTVEKTIKIALDAEISGPTELTEFSSIQLTGGLLSTGAQAGLLSSLTEKLAWTWSLPAEQQSIISTTALNQAGITLTGTRPGYASLNLEVGGLVKPYNVKVVSALERLELGQNAYLSRGQSLDLYKYLNPVLPSKLVLPNGLDYKRDRLQGNLKWESSSSTVKVHPETGLITAVRAGSAKITVTYQDAVGVSFQASLNISVSNKDKY